MKAGIYHPPTLEGADPPKPMSWTFVRFRISALGAYQIGRLAAWMIYTDNRAALLGYQLGRREVQERGI